MLTWLLLVLLLRLSAPPPVIRPVLSTVSRVCCPEDYHENIFLILIQVLDVLFLDSQQVALLLLSPLLKHLLLELVTDRS